MVCQGGWQNITRKIAGGDGLETSMNRKIPPAAYILVAMVLGIIVGYMIFRNFPGRSDHQIYDERRT